MAAALSRLTKAIFNDENAVLPVSSYLTGQYGINGIFISTPAIVNKNGIRDVINIPLNFSEQEKMKFSEKIIRKSLKGVKHLIDSEAPTHDH